MRTDRTSLRMHFCQYGLVRLQGVLPFCICLWLNGYAPICTSSKIVYCYISNMAQFCSSQPLCTSITFITMCSLLISRLVITMYCWLTFHRQIIFTAISWRFVQLKYCISNNIKVNNKIELKIAHSISIIAAWRKFVPLHCRCGWTMQVIKCMITHYIEVLLRGR